MRRLRKRNTRALECLIFVETGAKQIPGVEKGFMGSFFTRIPADHIDGLLLFSGAPKNTLCVKIVAAKTGFFEAPERRTHMKKENELAIKVTKEIVVKFIEAGRLSVSSFQEAWRDIHETVSHSMKETKKTED